jgi:hypothetical protein
VAASEDSIGSNRDAKRRLLATAMMVLLHPQRVGGVAHHVGPGGGEDEQLIRCCCESVPLTVPRSPVSGAAARKMAIARARACGVMFSHAIRATIRWPKPSHAYAGRTPSTTEQSTARRMKLCFTMPPGEVEGGKT